MADSFHPLDKISTRRGEWVIKVMVIRIWSGAFKGNKNDDQPLEMLVHDSKGTRIHCSIPKHVVRSFRAILLEGQMFTISSFLVNKNNLWMRSNSHEFRITLLQRSRVVHIMPPSFAFQPFCFRPISSILYAEKLDQNILFDVLGEVIGREDPIDMVTKQGNESMRLALLVEDSEKTTISCTVFGGLVDMIQPHLDAEKYEPLIVAFQLFRAKEWNGKISIQSNFEASNVHINPNTKEAILFRESLIGSIEGETSLSTQRISHMSNKKYRAAIDDLRAGVYSIETIEDVYKAKEECHKKCIEFDGVYECDLCKLKPAQVETRYKLQAYVSDDTGSMCVVLWDDEATQVVGMSAAKAKERIKQGDGDDSYPEVLRAALDKKVILRINIKSGNISGNETIYSATKASLDANLIRKFSQSEAYPGSQVLKISSTLENCSSLDNSAHVGGIDCDSVLQIRQESVNQSKTTTSGKGRAKIIDSAVIVNLASDLDDKPIGQLSTNKKARVCVKKEKVSGGS